ncbi:MAG: tRNA uridine(34) 5-carboxymethylaminomethyl modification radical SAM/GNAT enzyme Elp3 [archaeon]
MPKNFSKDLAQDLKKGKIYSRRFLEKQKMFYAKKHGLNYLPKNTDVFVEGKIKHSFLQVKPVRSKSGVVVIAVMVPPHDCPGECIFCPSGINVITPKSYTGTEPATQRALKHNFNPFKQVSERLHQFEITGHKTDKIELIVMGGTFPSMPFNQQKLFVKQSLEAITGKKTLLLENAKLDAEKSKNRVIGITFETRPDYCKIEQINQFLEMGGTRVELGVQQVNDHLYKKLKRNHSVLDVVNATSLLKDSAFKVLYHVMPGLPFTSEQEDLKHFKELFSNPDFKPDMLKLYPCLLVKNSKLMSLYESGEFKPLDDVKAVRLLAKMKSLIPNYVRVMRVQRDISLKNVVAGVSKSNLREIVQNYMKNHSLECSCIRCREVGLQESEQQYSLEKLKLKTFTESYNASNGTEFFISIESNDRKNLLGFVRLRIPFKPFRKEITENTALIRELHVYGAVAGLGEKDSNLTQHKGFGRQLMAKAEEIALKEFNKKKMVVISGLGVKEYYFKLGYKKDGAFVSKTLTE